MLGKILLQQNNVPAATEVFRHGVATFPEHPDLCTTLGLLYMQVKYIGSSHVLVRKNETIRKDINTQFSPFLYNF